MKTISGTREEVEGKVVSLVVERIKKLLSRKKKVVFGVPGGRSVSGIISKLAKEKLNWKRVEIFLVDERCVSLRSKESNYQVVKDLPGVHAFDYKKGVAAYDAGFRKFGGRFDLVLLSIGEDGHVASLFPRFSESGENFMFVKDSPKPPKERMTATRKLLEKSGMAILLAFGEGKKEAFDEFLDEKVSVKVCPAKLLYNVKDFYVATDLT